MIQGRDVASVVQHFITREKIPHGEFWDCRGMFNTNTTELVWRSLQTKNSAKGA